MGHDSDEPSENDDLEWACRRRDQFYRAKSISSYFSTRFAALPVLNANRDQFVEWCDSGIEFHDIHMSGISTIVNTAARRLLGAARHPSEEAAQEAGDFILELVDNHYPLRFDAPLVASSARKPHLAQPFCPHRLLRGAASFLAVQVDVCEALVVFDVDALDHGNIVPAPHPLRYPIPRVAGRGGDNRAQQGRVRRVRGRRCGSPGDPVGAFRGRCRLGRRGYVVVVDVVDDVDDVDVVGVVRVLVVVQSE